MDEEPDVVVGGGCFFLACLGVATVVVAVAFGRWLTLSASPSVDERLDRIEKKLGVEPDHESGGR